MSFEMPVKQTNMQFPWMAAKTTNNKMVQSMTISFDFDFQIKVGRVISFVHSLL